ncbi:PD40 domain-containing protein [Marmoricola sp. OAE513]|uniref:TolB family protein n=1 Tax=Marmoricola sp. OAE513 TaxID=2817894 RepID=UPI001AE1EDA2
MGALSLLLAVSGLLAPAQAAASKVEVTRISGVPTSGVNLVLTVKVSNGKKGQKIWLERKVGSRWKVVSKKKLGASRQVNVASALKLGRTKFRVHVFAKGSNKAKVRKVTVTPLPRVSPAPYVDESFTISGKLPTTGKRSVQLQRRNGSAWTTVATKNSTGSGSVAFARAGFVGTAVYRLHAPKKKSKKKFTSPGVVVKPGDRTRLVSATPAGVAGNEPSANSAMSGNGRYVAFVSSASNLGPADAHVGDDIYLRDLVTRKTVLVSRGHAGATANGGSADPTISADGRFVAFSSFASNLVPNDFNAGFRDIFRWDRVTGAMRLVSHDSSGTGSNNDSIRPSMSADGRRIAYSSAATDLTSETDDNSAADIFLWTEATDSASRLSKPSNNATNAGGGSNPRISADGKWVAFTSSSDVIDGASGQTNSAFLRNVQAATTQRVSTTTCTGGQSFPVGVTNGGTLVAFYSTCADIVGAGDANGTWDMFVRKTSNGAFALVSHQWNDKTEAGDSSAFGPADLAPDGSHMVFASRSENLTQIDGNGDQDIFLWTAATNSNVLVSRRRDTFEGLSSNGDNQDATFSDNARLVAWTSEATNVAAGDTSSAEDVVYRDLR